MESLVEEDLSQEPIVALLGPRQCGKTTLAKRLAGKRANPVYLDLERPSDRRKLSDPELYLAPYSDRLVVLDEIQRVPDLFPVLRSLVDADRHPGRFLVLGSASRDLLRQSSETLAGRIRFRELTPFTLEEVMAEQVTLDRHWSRGGFPPSLLSRDERQSFQWREDFLRTFLERDVPSFGIEVRTPLFERFLRMLAHLHGQILNWSRLAESAAVSVPTARHYVELLEKSFLVRVLPPSETNPGKRLVKSPRIYWRDSGLLHTLLEIEDFDQLQGHPAVGASWEGYAMEEILREVPRVRASYYRTHAGTELDLVLERGKLRMGVEFKRSSAPEPTRGFWEALRDLKLGQARIVAPVASSWPLADGVKVVPLHGLMQELSDWGAAADKVGEQGP
ncbi:MAG TPA: ATP-binding protein [Fibrobacteria bacterium]|nr:ATP-binding protein [Fibrobacteria bacterium]